MGKSASRGEKRGGKRRGKGRIQGGKVERIMMKVEVYIERHV